VHFIFAFSNIQSMIVVESGLELSQVLLPLVSFALRANICDCSSLHLTILLQSLQQVLFVSFKRVVMLLL